LIKHITYQLYLYIKTEQARGIKSVLVLDLKNEQNTKNSNVHPHHNKKFRLINSRYECTFGDSKLHATIMKYFLACKEHDDSKPPSAFWRVYLFHSLLRSSFNDAAWIKIV